MKFHLLGALLICFIASHAQTEVKLEQLKDHIGDNVKVHGKISGVEYSSGSGQKSMLIYLGEKYPRQALTVFISADVLNKLPIVPSPADAGNIMLVSGKVEQYKGKARINIKAPVQLDVIDNWQGEVEL